MMVKREIDVNAKPSRAQLEEIERAAKGEIVCDEDCPELTLSMIEEIKVAAQERKNRTGV